MPQQEEQNTRNLGFNTGEEPPIPIGKSWFFGVGINTYAHFPRLNNARKDIEDILQLLQERYQLDESITLLDEAANRQTIIDQLYALQGKLKENDKLIIFYSGHGHLDGKNRGYWMPADAQPGKVSSFIRSSTILELVEDIGCRHILLASDSCFSGALLTRDMGYAQQALDELERDRSRWVISSGRSREPVADGRPGENSPFAGSILKVLRDNQQMRLNAGLLFDQVTKLTRFNYKQMPQNAPLFGAGHQGGQYVFHLKSNEAADWKACQEEGTLAAYQAFLAKYPDGIHSEEAKEQVAFLKEEQAWKAARRKNTVEGYFKYRKNNPIGRYREQALEMIRELEEEQDWRRAGQANTVFAYENYLDKYPSGLYRKEAEVRMRAILSGQEESAAHQQQQEKTERQRREQEAAQRELAAWQEAESRNTLVAYEAYLQQYPEGLHALEALATVQELHRKAKEQARQEALAHRQQLLEMERQRREWEATQQKMRKAAIPSPEPKPKDTLSRQKKDKPKLKWKPLRRFLPYLMGLLFLIVLAIWVIPRILNPSVEGPIDGADLIPYEDPKHNYYGYKNKNGKIIIIPRFRYAGPFSENRAVVGKGSLYGYINPKGGIVSDFQYHQAEAFSNGLAVVGKDQKFGYIDTSGNVVIPLIYSKAGSFNEGGQASVEQDGSGMTIDKQGKCIKNCPGGEAPEADGDKINDLSQPKTEQSTPKFITDKRSGYKEKRFNGKTWLAENLNLKADDSWCYNEGDENCQKYGRLYTWKAAQEACKKLGADWRLPTDEEWKELAKAFGGYYDGETGKVVGDPKKAYSAMLKKGEDDFAALLGGWRSTDGSFSGLGDYGSYWSAMKYSSGSVWRYSFYSYYGKLYRSYGSKALSLSCRCVRD